MGRHQLRRGVYDCIVTDQEDAQAPVGSVFDMIVNLLTSIQ